MSAKIDHIAMYVNDLEGAKNFFLKYFDVVCSNKYHNPATDFKSYYIFFSDGKKIEIMTKPSMDDKPKALNRSGYVHLCISLGDRESVDRLAIRLKEDGYNIISGPRMTGNDYYEFLVLAFEGNQIEVCI